MSTKLTPALLAELRAKASEATPPDNGAWYSGDAIIVASHQPRQRFIAAANPATVLALLDRIEELEREVKTAWATGFDQGMGS